MERALLYVIDASGNARHDQPKNAKHIRLQFETRGTKSACATESSSKFLIVGFQTTDKMITFIFILFASCLEIPSDYAELMQRSQWMHISDYARSPCVLVDAYVRPYTQTLFLSVIGVCDGLRPGVVWCEIKSGRASRKMQKAVDVKLGAANDVRGGKITSPLNNGMAEPIKLWYQYGIDCGTVSQKGIVTILYSNSSFNNVPFSFPSDDLVPTGSGVCTRLYDHIDWSPLQTQILLEWIEWQLSIGFTTIRIYIYSLQNADVWRALATYAKLGKVVLHAWSEGGEDDSVSHMWEYAQVAFLTDCLLRLEGTVLYSTALDHDEFLQPSLPYITDALDAHYNEKKSVSNILMFEPVSVPPVSCSGGGELKITSFCRGMENPFGKHKYAIRSNEDHPFLMLPAIHSASDGRPVSRVNRKLLGLYHITSTQIAGKTKIVNLEWNSDVANLVRQSFANRVDAVHDIYTALQETTYKETPSPGCLKFVDGGSEGGESLLRFAFPSRFAKSGLAMSIKSIDTKDYVCRHVFAFEGNPKFNDQLHARCTELVHNNITCSTFQGILGARAGVTEFFVDTSSRATNMLGSSIFERPGTSSVEVAVFDLAAFLRSATVTSDYVIVKLDVEGSEYDILQALVKDNGRPKACKLIDMLLIEWHGAKFNGVVAAPRKDLQQKYNAPLEVQQTKITDALKQCGVDVRAVAGVTD